MAKYTVQSPIKSGGKIHDIGAVVALDEETAAPLLALGRIKSAAAKNSSGDSGDASSSEDSGDAARQAAKSEAPAPGASTAASAKKSGGKK